MKMLKIVQLIESMKHGLSINMELNGIELIICKENVEMLIHVEESDYSRNPQNVRFSTVSIPQVIVDPPHGTENSFRSRT